MPGDDNTQPPPDVGEGNEEQQLQAGEDSLEQQEQRQAMDRMNERNRILMEARMLPAHSALSAQHVSQIIEHFKSYLEQHKEIKAAQVAREVQFSPTTISEWMAGRYKGDISGVTRAINNWMERDARRRQARRPKDYVKTWVAEDIRTYAYMADKQGRMAVIVAPSGTGKTKVLKALAEEMRGLYVCCSQSMNIRGLFLAMARELDWRREGGSRQELEQYIIRSLTGTSRILLIDEAHQLGSDIRALRSIHDQAAVPIVMVGTDEIEAHANDKAHGRGQFSSRCIFYSALDHVSSRGGGGGGSQGKDLFTIEEIREFFSRRKIRLSNDALQMIWAVACQAGYGCLRLAEAVMDMAFILDPDAQSLSRDDVLAALKMVERKAFPAILQMAKRQLDEESTDTRTIARAG